MFTLLLYWTLQIFARCGVSGEDFQNVQEISISRCFFVGCQMGWIGDAILQVALKAVVEIQFLAYLCNVGNYFFCTSPL